jgi:hypothetical protein
LTSATTQESSARVEVASGEMQPWTDAGIGGPALAGLLADRCSRPGSVLVLGPHDAAVTDVLLGASDSLTVLRRSPSDATEIAAGLPEQVRVVAGSLDGFVASGAGTYDLVVAADGLDRVLSTDSPPLSWSERLSLVSKLLTPGGELLLGLPNEMSVIEVLDARPSKERHGNEEWWPLHSDATRPSDLGRAAGHLAPLGLQGSASWVRFGEGSPQALLPVGELESVAADHPYTDLLVASARRTSRPLLADPEELVRNAARAGRLTDLADGWLVHATRAIESEAPVKGYVALDDATFVELLRQGAELNVSVRTSASRRPAGHAAAASPDAESETGDTLVSGDPALLPATLVESASVASVLLAQAEAEDVPAFRRQAAAVGQWFASHGSERAVALDDLRLVGDDIVEGLGMFRWAAAVTPAEAMAAAWFDFHDELVLEHRRHPWPPWVVGDDLVVIWLGMSGHEASDSEMPALLRRGRELADALKAARGAQRPTVRDVRSVLADADRVAQELFEAKGHIAGLERTIGFRDRQLATREDRIRALRKKIAKVERLQQTAPYKLANRTRKVFAQRDRKELIGQGKRVVKRVARKVIKR